MYPKGVYHGGLGMKNSGGKLIGASKGSNGVADHSAMMAAMAMVAPEVSKKPYGKIEKK
jgi:hypothetical protein